MVCLNIGGKNEKEKNNDNCYLMYGMSNIMWIDRKRTKKSKVRKGG